MERYIDHKVCGKRVLVVVCVREASCVDCIVGTFVVSIPIPFKRIHLTSTGIQFNLGCTTTHHILESGSYTKSIGYSGPDGHSFYKECNISHVTTMRCSGQATTKTGRGRRQHTLCPTQPYAPCVQNRPTGQLRSVRTKSACRGLGGLGARGASHTMWRDSSAMKTSAAWRTRDASFVMSSVGQSGHKRPSVVCRLDVCAASRELRWGRD